MATRVVEGKKPYTGGEAISIDENKVISLNLRDENNLIIYDSGDDEIYVDLQLPDGIEPTDAFPVGITTGRVLVADDWDITGTLICAKTTSGDNIKILYGDDGTLWMDNGTGTFKQIYFKADVDALLLALRQYIDTELAKKQNGVASATAPENPVEGDLWYDTINDELKVYDGTNWNATGTGGGSDIVYATQAEYNALLPGAASDGKHYVIYVNTTPAPRQPGVNTLLYMEFNGDLSDSSGNSNQMSGSGIGYGIIGDKKYVELTSNSGGISGPGNLMASVGTGDFASAFWFYPVGSSDGPVMFDNAQSSSPRSGCQMFICYDSRWNLNNQVSYHMTQVGHGSSMSATSLNNSWHHFVFTRISGICYGYIDGQEAFTSWSDNSNLSGVDSLYILNRSNQSDQQRDNPGAKMSELIVESVGWTAQEVSDYFDQTKADYGIS